MRTKQLIKENTINVQLLEMADSHCHLDLIKDTHVIKYAIDSGVRTIITNGVDTKSNMRCLELADDRHIFALLGIDPEHAGLKDDELEFNINLARQNRNKIKGIGEIGLDYGKVKGSVPIARQKVVFGKFLDLAIELKVPVSIHSRDAMADVLHILEEKGIEHAHMHFFEGNIQQAKEVEKRGYMISVPPVKSEKRGKVIKEMAIDNIMAESDAPAVGISPRDVERSIGIVAEAKKIDFKKAADLLTQNTKRFFKIGTTTNFMRL